MKHVICTIHSVRIIPYHTDVVLLSVPVWWLAAHCSERLCPSVEINLSVGQHLNLSESNGYRFGMLRDAGNPLIGPLSLNIELSQW